MNKMDNGISHNKHSILSEHYGFTPALLEDVKPVEQTSDTFSCCGVVNLLPVNWVIFVCPRCKAYASREGTELKGTHTDAPVIFDEYADFVPCECPSFLECFADKCTCHCHRFKGVVGVPK